MPLATSERYTPSPDDSFPIIGFLTDSSSSMAAPHVLVLRAPGTNCDVETAYAFEACGARATRVHLFRVLEQPALLAQSQILCIPGGFSYGDDVGAGVIFGLELRTRLRDALARFVDSGNLVLGICNGFQVLMRSGLLPGGTAGLSDTQPPQATLTWNANGRYTDRWVRLAVGETQSVFLKGMTALDVPIAHGEGRIAVTSPAVVANWETAGQIALRYARPGSDTSSDELLPEPINPNGSIANIAGLCDPTGRVLGLMPHPERHLFATQHPQWTRRAVGAKSWGGGTAVVEATAEGEGMPLFRNGVQYFD
jgi:phosphoribosylformylglycinamidine synthase I